MKVQLKRGAALQLRAVVKSLLKNTRTVNAAFSYALRRTDQKLDDALKSLLEERKEKLAAFDIAEKALFEEYAELDKKTGKPRLSPDGVTPLVAEAKTEAFEEAYKALQAKDEFKGPIAEMDKLFEEKEDFDVYLTKLSSVPELPYAVMTVLEPLIVDDVNGDLNKGA